MERWFAGQLVQAEEAWPVSGRHRLAPFAVGAAAMVVELASAGVLVLAARHFCRNGLYHRLAALVVSG